MRKSFQESIEHLSPECLKYVLELYENRYPGLSMMEIAALEKVSILFCDLGGRNEPALVRFTNKRILIAIDAALPMEDHMVHFALRLREVEQMRSRRNAA